MWSDSSRRSEDTAHPSLRAALRALAADDETRGASAEVEARLRAEVRSIGWARRRRVARVTWAATAALFAMVAAGLWHVGTGRMAAGEDGAARVASRRVDGGRARTRQGDDGARGRATGTAAARHAAREIRTGFLPLPYSHVPVMDGQIVRLEVPRAALASFGLGSIDRLDRGSAGTVLADVLVGQDGLARAVRFVRPAAYEERQP